MIKLPLVILAAGKGTRLQPLTNTVAEPLLPVCGKPILLHTIEGALPYISEIVLVVSNNIEQFEALFQHSYEGIPVRYVHQQEQKGTGDALAATKDSIGSEWFYCIYGDDFYGPEGFQTIAAVEGNAVVGKKVADWHRFGVFKQSDDGTLSSVVEKPELFVGDLANIGIFRLHSTIFNHISSMQPSERGELELTDMITTLAANEPITVLETDSAWIPIAYPWDLLTVAEYLLTKMESDIQGIVEVGAVIKGKVQLGKGSVILAGAYINGNVYIGENCTIGPNCYIRNFASIGDNCLVGASVEIKGSIMGSGSKAAHLAYIPDSILGANVNYAAGTITADLKHDGSNVKSMVNGVLVDTGRRKFGTVMGDGSRTGIHTTIYPGRKIWNDTSTLPGQIVKTDIQ